MSTREHAESELKKIGMLDSENELDRAMCKQVLEMCEVFDNQSNSGASADYEIGILLRVLKYQPLSPLTGNEDEWISKEVFPQQNKRCPYIFKEADGRVYNSRAKVFSDDGESWYLTEESREEITFPYTVPTEPKRIIRRK